MSALVTPVLAKIFYGLTVAMIRISELIFVHQNPARYRQADKVQTVKLCRYHFENYRLRMI